MPISLLVVGQTARAAARPLAAWLRTSLASATTREFRDLTAALGEIATDSWIPDLVVVVQSWPDEFSPRDVDRLLAFAPLARFVICYGDWCESDGRNRSVWPLAVRIPLRSATARVEREWRLLHNEPGLQPLPLSASRDEVFAADHPPIIRSMNRGSITVDSPDMAYRQYLVQLLSNAGDSCETSAHADAASTVPVVLFDADPWNERRQSDLRELREQDPTIRIVTLQCLPNASDEATLLHAGVVAILPKLGDQQRLLDAVESTHECEVGGPSVPVANPRSCQRIQPTRQL